MCSSHGASRTKRTLPPRTPHFFLNGFFINASAQNHHAALRARLTLGTVMVAHGLLKFIVFTLPGTSAFFSSVGFPGWAAYIVAPLEVIAGLALIIGFHARWAALATLPVSLGALMVHAGNGWLFTNANGGWEYPLVLVMLGAVVSLRGDGAFALRKHAI
jgi:putative oxidoreductase